MGFFDGVYRLLRCSLGIIFIYAGFIKLLHPVTFAVLIEAYGIVPEMLLLPVAVLLAVLEVAAGIGLFFDIEWSLSIMTGLLVLFVVILSYGIWMGLDIDCGCFGPGDPEAEAFHGLKLTLCRDLVMLAGVVFLFGWRRYKNIKPIKIKLFIEKMIRRKEQGELV